MDNSFPVFAILGEPLSSLRQPLSGPLPFFVALRGYVFAFLPLHAPLSSLFQPLRVPSWITLFPSSRSLANPSRASANPLVALCRSSWPFVDMFLPFRGFPFSTRRPLAAPSRASANPLVALCRSSWPFVDIFFSFLPLHAPLSSLFQPLRVPSWITLFPFSPFVDIFFPLPDPWRTPLDLPPTP